MAKQTTACNASSAGAMPACRPCGSQFSSAFRKLSHPGRAATTMAPIQTVQCGGFLISQNLRVLIQRSSAASAKRSSGDGQISAGGCSWNSL
ncbi:MAG TPA: hypothetical protein DC058_00760 [Planctomycetaceae bacterium]|nr:hypothetical protein [Planctomycetaceae bacterium]